VGPRAVLDAVVKRKIPSLRDSQDKAISLRDDPVYGRLTSDPITRIRKHRFPHLIRSLMMMTEMVLETSVQYGHLTRVITREDFV
jgi:hypothetical protein